jgi:hypothetical protein
MTDGDETRATPRPSLFDDRSAEETQVVQNPYPPAHRGDRRPPVQAPGGQGGGYGQPGQQPSHGAPYGAPYGGSRPGASPQPDHGGLFDEATTARTPSGGGPNILANQAVDWEGNLQESDVVRGSRTGLIALFVLALIVVVVVAVGFAAWTVLTGGDDSTETGATTSTTLDTGTTVPPVETTSTTVLDPNQLRVTVTEDPFVCDGETREFALLGGAEPNESVSFSSPQASGLRSGQADALGDLPIRWQCDPAQAGTTWELTATGDTSGKSVTFIFAGVTAGQTTGTAPTGTAPTALVVDIIENPFACDGGTRVFAGLTGAEPNESIAFSSPQSPGLRSGQADATGALPIRWQCDPAQAGTTWELTATGETSGRTVTFTFTGS